MEATGRCFTVRADGTLVLLSGPSDADSRKSSGISQAKAPMKVVVPRSTSESLKAQLKYPAGRVAKNNINDSMNLRDFVEYGAKTAYDRKARNDSGNHTPSFDVRKWC